MEEERRFSEDMVEEERRFSEDWSGQEDCIDALDLISWMRLLMRHSRSVICNSYMYKFRCQIVCMLVVCMDVCVSCV